MITSWPPVAVQASHRPCASIGLTEYRWSTRAAMPSAASSDAAANARWTVTPAPTIVTLVYNPVHDDPFFDTVLVTGRLLQVRPCGPGGQKPPRRRIEDGRPSRSYTIR